MLNIFRNHYEPSDNATFHVHLFFIILYYCNFVFFNIVGTKENTTDLFNIFLFALPFCQIDVTIYSQTIIF